MKRMLINIICCVLGVVCVGYFLIYMYLIDLTNTFTWFWFLAGIFFVACAFCNIWMDRHHRTLPVWLSRGGLVVIGLCVLIFLAAEGVIIGYGWTEPKKGADYVIVLGARVSGTRPTYNLEQRLKKAYQYLSDNPSSKAILSGGQGRGEDISEAAAMKEYLSQRGISEERLILEDKSVNTDQNLSFSMERLESKDVSVVIVSNRFHVFRALRLAKKKGMTNVQGFGAPVKWYTVPNMYVREGFAVIKYAIFGQI